jgi:hypothetical protein
VFRYCCFSGAFSGEVSGVVYWWRIFRMVVLGAVVCYLFVLIFTVGFGALFTNFLVSLLPVIKLLPACLIEIF